MQTFTLINTCSKLPSTTDELIQTLLAAHCLSNGINLFCSILKMIMEISIPLYISHGANIAVICRSATAKPIENKNKNLFLPPQHIQTSHINKIQ